MPIQYYCTLFDSNYLSRGLALHESLIAWNRNLRLIILCLDEATYEILSLMRLAQVDLVSIEHLHAYDPELERARQNRTLVEYYFTSKSVLMTYVLDRFDNPARITYLDSDLYYFSDPGLLEKEIEASSVALTPHGFPKHLDERRRYGTFNAGWVSVGADREGREFLAWWRRKCIDWCHATVEEHRFADQKYLDQVPGLFSNCHVVSSRGSNVAPWNLGGRQPTASAAGMHIDGDPLIFFHFHGVRRVLWRFYDSGLLAYGVCLTPAIRHLLYVPYLHAVARLERQALRTPSPARDETAQRHGGRPPSVKPKSDDLPAVVWGLLRSGTGVFVV